MGWYGKHNTTPASTMTYPYKLFLINLCFEDNRMYYDMKGSLFTNKM